MGKKLCFIALIILLFFLAATTAYAAESVTYTLNELDMTIDVPSDYIVFTRDMDIEDPQLALYGFGQDELDELVEYYKETNIFLDACSEDLNYELFVTMFTDDSLQELFDFNLFTDQELTEYAQILSSGFAAQGVNVLKIELLSPRHPQAKFYKIYLSDSDQYQYRLQFYTIVNGKAINVYFDAVDPVDEALESRVMEIVNTISFKNQPIAETSPSVNPETESTPSTISEAASSPEAGPEEELELPQEPINYYNKAAGVSFVVPVGWSEKDLLEEREHIRTKYIDLNGNTLLFGYSDLYASAEGARYDYSRSDFNNELFAKADIERILNTEGSQVTSIEYETVNGIEYYRLTRELDTVTDGIGVQTTMLSYIMIYHGIMYEFSSSDALDSNAYEDFMELMSSIRYDNITTSVLKESFDLPYNTSNEMVALTIVLSIVFTVVVYSAPILIYRFAIKKEPVPYKKARKITFIYGGIALTIVIVIGTLLGDASPGGAVFLWSFINYKVLVSGKSRKKIVVTNAPVSASVLNCKSCGAVLPGDSLFCDSCGLIIDK